MVAAGGTNTLFTVPPRIELLTIRANGTGAGGKFAAVLGSPAMLIPPVVLAKSSLFMITAPGNSRWLLIVRVLRTEPGFGEPETGSLASAEIEMPNPEEFEILEFSISTWP